MGTFNYDPNPPGPRRDMLSQASHTRADRLGCGGGGDTHAFTEQARVPRATFWVYSTCTARMRSFDKVRRTPVVTGT